MLLKGDLMLDLSKESLENMFVGYHGSPKRFDKFQHCQYYSNYSNSALGIFVAQDIVGAIDYSYTSDPNTQGYVYIVAFKKEDILEVDEDLFFCFNEKPSEIDPMGNYVDLCGAATREEYLAQGYRGFKIADLENCGQAFAIFNPEDIIILEVLTTKQAIEKNMLLSSKVPSAMR